MPRFFNTAGPCKPEWHYMLPAAARLKGLRQVIDRMGYFVLHAPRQSGKTTALFELASQLTAEGRYAAVVLSAETGAWAGDDPGAAENAILGDWERSAQHRLPKALWPGAWRAATGGSRVAAALAGWCESLSRPLVLFLDEADALRDNALVSVLRQLRSGYNDRPTGFPQSIGLVGLRDVRDYVVASGGSGRLGSSSPFNIKLESFTVGDFTRDEVASLYSQHTSDTGQEFEPPAIDLAYSLTMGQPWLVNALAAQATDVVVPDRAVPVTAAHVDEAREILIRRQDTHLDSLGERLREDRVRAVIEPIIAGTSGGSWAPDDVRYVNDLGLARQTPLGGVQIANPIYREIISRVLEVSPRAQLPEISPTWLLPSGDIDIDQLMASFLDFWRRHGEALLGTAPYREVAAQLVMMAFLDRVANGGGRIDREFALGRGRIDLCLSWHAQRFAFELKVWRDGEPDPVEEGLPQLDEYLAKLGLQTGWLVVFDQRPGLPRARERTSASQVATPNGRDVMVVRA